MAQNIDADAFINTFTKRFSYQYCLGDCKPAEGVPYTDAVVDTANKSFVGRMSKQEYLLYIIPAIILCYIPVVNIVLFLPNCSCTARRLHDVGMTGWLCLASIIPVVNIILVVYLCITDGQKEANQYGEAPADAAQASSAE